MAIITLFTFVQKIYLNMCNILYCEPPLDAQGYFKFSFFLSSPPFYIGGVSYSYSVLSLLFIPNHILIYFTCPHILPNNPYPLLFWLTPSPISLYF